MAFLRTLCHIFNLFLPCINSKIKLFASKFLNIQIFAQVKKKKKKRSFEFLNFKFKKNILRNIYLTILAIILKYSNISQLCRIKKKKMFQSLKSLSLSFKFKNDILQGNTVNLSTLWRWWQCRSSWCVRLIIRSHPWRRHPVHVSLAKSDLGVSLRLFSLVTRSDMIDESFLRFLHVPVARNLPNIPVQPSGTERRII